MIIIGCDYHPGFQDSVPGLHADKWPWQRGPGVPKPVLFGTLRCDVLIVATEWLTGFKSYGFMEQAENAWP